MKTWVWVAAIVFAGAGAPAAAQSGFDDGWPAQRGRQAQQRDDTARDTAPRRPGGEDGRRHGRLSEDERRQLHRDLDRANRELYRQRRDRRP